jgi:hypothetical protein
MISKFIDFILNLLDPPSQMEKRLERRWQCKLRKLEKQMRSDVFIHKGSDGKQNT